MEITLDKKSTTEGRIRIKLNEGDYRTQVDQKMRDYARKASLKGFRPGKVPAGIIQKMFGKSIVVDEINHLINNKISDYIRENNLRILGDPLPDREKADQIDWENQKEFEFEYDIGMVEEFKYDLSAKIKVTSYPIELKESTVEESVTDLRKRFGKTSYPETSDAGDTVYGKLKNADGTWEKAGATVVIDTLSKSAKAQFIGRKKEDVIEFDVKGLFEEEGTLSELLHSHEPAGDGTPSGRYALTVETISRMEPSEMNQDLFDRVFGKNTAGTEQEFVQKVRDTIAENYQRETEHFLTHTIEDALVSGTKINIPEGFLKNWLKTTDENNRITDDVLDKEFKDYTRGLKWDLIKNKIAEDHAIKVETEEVKSRARDLIVSQFGGPAFADQIKERLDGIVDSYLSNENGKNFLRLYNQLRDERIFALIKEKITIAEKKVDVDEFRKLVETHHH